jgi:hypothetical protein
MTPTAKTPAEPLHASAALLLFVVLGGLAMISGDSLWIDELETMRMAQIDVLADAAGAIARSHNSEAQMPGYLMYAWAWEKLAGRNEWALRLSNLPWLLVMVGAAARVSATLKLRLLVPLLLVQPFVWAYADELRPYAMQLAGGALSLWAVTQYVDQRGRGAAWAASLTLAALLMCLASMLGAVATLAVYGCIAWTGWRRRWAVDRSATVVLIAGVLLLGALGAYYAQTLMRGAGGAKLWSVGVGNLALVGYEFLGFFGLGPGRDALREAARGGGSALAAIYLSYLPMVGSLAACYLLLALSQTTELFRDQSRPRLTVAAIAAAVLAFNIIGLLILSVIAEWPFWGRHLAPVFVYWVFLLALAAAAAWRRPLGRLGVVGLFAALAASSLTLRLAAQHRHDDYRGAARRLEAALDDGRHAWWAARSLADSDLYGKAFRSSAATSQLTVLFNPDDPTIAKAPTPDLIIISKRDVYDAAGAVARYIEERGYRLTLELKAFEFWEVAGSRSK